MRVQSRRILYVIPDQSLDIAYVDGSHEGCDVMLDGLLCLHLLKIGGILLFDDYKWQGQQVTKGPWTGHVLPGPAIDAFKAIAGWRLKELHRDYQVAFRRIA